MLSIVDCENSGGTGERWETKPFWSWESDDRHIWMACYLGDNRCLRRKTGWACPVTNPRSPWAGKWGVPVGMNSWQSRARWGGASVSKWRRQQSRRLWEARTAVLPSGSMIPAFNVVVDTEYIYSTWKL